MSEDTQEIQRILEQYLFSQGLFSYFPENRLRDAVISPIGVIALLLPVIGGFIAALAYHQSIVLGIGIPLAMLIGLVILPIALEVLVSRRAAKGMTSPENDARPSCLLTCLSTILILAYPFVTGLVLGITFREGELIILYWIISPIVLFIVGKVFESAPPLLHWLGAAYSLLKSPALILRLSPLLLVLAILSLFSEEYWQIIASLSTSRFLAVVSCLFIPGLVSVMGLLFSQLPLVTHNYSQANELIGVLEGLDVLKKSRQQGYLTDRAWQNLLLNIRWRHISLEQTQIQGSVHKDLRRRFAVVIGAIALILFGISSCYFWFLILLLVPSRNIDVVNNASALPFFFNANSALIKIALVTSSFIVSIFGVNIFSDEAFRSRLFDPFRQQIRGWVAAAITRDILLRPDYQLYRHEMPPTRKLVNVSLIVPKGITEERIVSVVSSFIDNYPKAKYLYITAFERAEESEEYVRGISGRKWLVIWNKAKSLNYPTLVEQDHYDSTHLREQHLLGTEGTGRKDAIEIEDDWFGNTPQAISFGRWLWEKLDSTDLIHPFVFIRQHITRIELHLARRFSSSTRYREFVRQVLQEFYRTIDFDGEPSYVEVVVTLRDNVVYSLAWLAWSPDLPYIQYRDERSSLRYERPQKWLP